MQRDWVMQWCNVVHAPSTELRHCLIDHIDYLTLDVMTVHWPSSISDSCLGSLSLACHILKRRFWLIGPLAVLASGGSIAVNGVIAGADFRHLAATPRFHGWHCSAQKSGVPCSQKSLTSGTSETFLPKWRSLQMLTNAYKCL